jgi:hypothetical protein
MKKTPYRKAIFFERVLFAIFIGIGSFALLSRYNSFFVLLVFLLLLVLIFVGIWYGLLTCPTCGRPVSWRKSRFEDLVLRCRGCGANLDEHTDG